MRKSNLERTLDAALQDRECLALTLTDVREDEDELRDVLDRAFGAAERNCSSLTEIQLRKSQFDAATLTSCTVRITESGEAGVFRLIFRRHGAKAPGARAELAEPTSSNARSSLFLSIPLDLD